MRTPKESLYGEKERFEVALAIAPIILKEIYASVPIIERVKEIAPSEINKISKLIIEELNK